MREGQSMLGKCLFPLAHLLAVCMLSSWEMLFVDSGLSKQTATLGRLFFFSPPLFLIIEIVLQSYSCQEEVVTFKLKSSFPFTTALLSWQQTSQLACVKWTLVDRGSWMAKLTVDSVALLFLRPLFMQLSVWAFVFLSPRLRWWIIQLL